MSRTSKRKRRQSTPEQAQPQQPQATEPEETGGPGVVWEPVTPFGHVVY